MTKQRRYATEYQLTHRLLRWQIIRANKAMTESAIQAKAAMQAWMDAWVRLVDLEKAEPVPELVELFKEES